MATTSRWVIAVALGLSITCAGAALSPAEAGTGPDRDAVLARLRAERERAIERLHAYRVAAAFPGGFQGQGALDPQDPHFAPGRAHAFRAPNGALCAVAHLIDSSGRHDLVQRIAREDNGLCVGRTTDAEVLAWVLDSGLTLEECVRIQEPGFTEDRLRQPEPELQERPDVEPRVVVVDPVAFLGRHLEQVEAELRRNTEDSLRVAVDRALAQHAS